MVGLGQGTNPPPWSVSSRARDIPKPGNIRCGEGDGGGSREANEGYIGYGPVVELAHFE